MTIDIFGWCIFERKKIMELELKHLAPYLPYDIQGKYILSDVVSLSTGQKDEVRNKKLASDCVHFFLSFCKPVLRPISDLTKEIEHNGGKYSVDDIIFPKDEYGDDFTRKCAIEALKLSNAIQHVNTPYSIVEVLFKYHFDVFGLIEQGLAIDINTVD